MSRYNNMTASKVLDIDKEAFPDPLSCRYNDVQFSGISGQERMSSAALSKFWLWMWKTYATCDYDDILLNLNGIPYIGMMQPGDILFKIPARDLLTFQKQRVLGEEDT